MTQPFLPRITTVASTSTTANKTAIADARGRAPVRVKNRSYTAGDGIYFKFGTSSDSDVTSSTGMLIGPGETEMFTLPDGATHVLALAQANTPGLEVTVGELGA